GIAAVPPIPVEIRRAVRNRLTAEGVAALHEELRKCDPATAARLKPGDRARITRALEVVLATGRSLTQWQEDNMPARLDLAAAADLFLVRIRGGGGRRLGGGSDAVRAGAAWGDARAPPARILNTTRPARKARGVRWLTRHQKGEIGGAEGGTQAKRDPRRYTK